MRKKAVHLYYRRNTGSQTLCNIYSKNTVTTTEKYAEVKCWRCTEIMSDFSGPGTAAYTLGFSPHPRFPPEHFPLYQGATTSACGSVKAGHPEFYQRLGGYHQNRGCKHCWKAVQARLNELFAREAIATLHMHIGRFNISPINDHQIDTTGRVMKNLQKYLCWRGLNPIVRKEGRDVLRLAKKARACKL